MARSYNDNAPTIADANVRNAANISRADRGPRLKPEHLSALIAEYIAEVARAKECSIREVRCPPTAEWGQGLLPTATRLRLGNPGKYPNAREAIWGEFEKTKGNLLLPPTVRSAMAAKLVDYSVWYPPSPEPPNRIVSKMVVGRGNTDGDSDSFACCLVPPPSVLNSLQDSSNNLTGNSNHPESYREARQGRSNSGNRHEARSIMSIWHAKPHNILP